MAVSIGAPIERQATDLWPVSEERTIRNVPLASREPFDPNPRQMIKTQSKEGAMFIQLLTTVFVAGFAGIVVFGHVLLFQAIFARKVKPTESVGFQLAPVPARA
jgi:hypothetical protein